MTRFNYPHSSDTSMTEGLKTASMARSAAGCFVIAGIVLIATLTGCHQQPVASARAADVDASRTAVQQSTDTDLDTQLRLDPAEIMFYSSNVHG